MIDMADKGCSHGNFLMSFCLEGSRSSLEPPLPAHLKFTELVSGD
jgi:hypothetical protein